MTKYIDLAERIVDDSGTISQHVMIGVKEALDWLDEHPDQVPGRTITRSHPEGLVKLMETMPYNASGIVRDLVRRLDFTVVPDPEPTNAEKLEKLFADLMKCQLTYREAAVQMDMLGVKAPGGDDD